MTLKPQTAAALAMLRRHPEGATALTALDEIGSFRLAARIDELRHEGYEIETEYRTLTHGKRIAVYTLQEQMRMAL